MDMPPVSAQALRPEIRPGFWGQFPLLPERTVIHIARMLSHAFQPLVAFFLIILTMLFITTVLIMHGLSFQLYTRNFWLGFVLFVVMLLFHEFGHASACAHYGNKPGAIGCIIYLIYPAFYSDVSAAWKLKGRERVVVDLGGIFFQLVIGALYASVYLVSHWEALRIAILLTLYSCILSLNPLFRFDGYWIVADALGIPNLGKQTRQVWFWLFKRKRSGEQGQKRTYSMPVQLFLLSYSLLCLCAWSFLAIFFLPILYHYILAYPVLVQQTFQSLTQSSLTFFADIQNLVFSSLAIIAPVALIALRLARQTRSLQLKVRRKRHVES